MRFYGGPRLGTLPSSIMFGFGTMCPRLETLPSPILGMLFPEKKKKKDNKSFLDTLKIDLERVMKFKLRL
jgi:hypothetical protein